MLAVVALTLTSCAAEPSAVDPDIMAKAQAYEQKVKDEIGAEIAAEAEGKHVRMTFPADRPLRLLVTGDSLADGFFASTKDAGFTKIVERGIEKVGPVEVVGASQAHATLSKVNSILEVPPNLDLAIVELGTNDVGAKTDTASFDTQYGALLFKIKKQSPSVAMICLSTWQSPATTAPAYNNIINKNCSEAGGRYVDLTGTFLREANRGPAGADTWGGKSDMFHPNDKGHKAIADLILDRIKMS